MLDAGIAGAVAAEALTAPSVGDARAKRRRSKRRQTVAVFGGGIAGLTAAHELAERGFDVTVYERRAWGGKARSMDVPGTGVGGRKPLPGEHSFREFFGFYQNLPATMQRIPYGSNPKGVFDNLVELPAAGLTRIGKPMITLPLTTDQLDVLTPVVIRDTLLSLALRTDLPPEAAAHLADRLLVYFSSCDARRLGQWENVSWADFIASDRYGGDYRTIFANVFGYLLWGTKASNASTNIVGKTFEWIVYNLLGRNSNGPPDRSFNAPTSEAFIDPWIALLRDSGVDLRLGSALKRFHMSDGRLAGATVRTRSRLHEVSADWYVSAVPLFVAQRLWSPAMIAADTQLARTRRLEYGWGNGMKFFLRKPTPIVRGHVVYVDSPWVMASVSQAQFWHRDFAATYGDGTVHESLSVLWIDWDTPGIIYGKPARKCTPEELAREAWEQMRRHFSAAEQPLTDDLLHSWFIDPGLLARGDGFHNEDYVTQPNVGAWPNRPEPTSAIPNLILAGDYVRNGTWEMAHMEAANVSGRQAANAILDHTGTHETPARVIGTYRPPEWEALKRLDAQRYARGHANLLDTDLGTSQILDLLHG